MPLKIPTTDKLLDLQAIYGIAKLSANAKGCDLTYLFMRTLPEDIADYELRSDVTTEAVSDLVGNVYTVADNTFYRVGEAITVYGADTEVKGAVRVIEKQSTDEILVEKILINGIDFTLANNDSLFIKADEILTDGTSFIYDLETFNKHRFILVKASEELANNLDISNVTDKKKN